jgi:hypothetical protein
MHGRLAAGAGFAGSRAGRAPAWRPGVARLTFPRRCAVGTSAAPTVTAVTKAQRPVTPR